MNIHVGIVGGNFHGWLSLLQQEGIPHSTSVHDLSPDRFSVIVAGDTAEERTIKSIKKYLAGGGAVLCSGKVFEQLSNSVCIQSPIRYLLGASDYHFAGIGLIDCYRQCHVHPYANVVNSDSGKPCIFMGEYGGGTIVVLPFDAGGLMLDTRTSTKSFYAEHHRLPFEHVSLVSKGGLLKLVARSLELLHHERGLPYAHAWHFPSHEKTIFCFRIDTDYASRKELGDLYHVMRQHDLTATWFVDVKSQQAYLDLFRDMDAHEIGIHCYEHATYEDYPRNVKNIRRALDVFNRCGLHASSFAGPYGLWNEHLARAINDCSFEFSSEFSYDYDNVPSAPVIGHQMLDTLQLPVHPISIGSLRRQGFDEQEMKTYFSRLLERKLHDREPIILYHHPKDDNEYVLHTVFDLVKQHHIKTLRMMDYGRWWKNRAATMFHVEIDRSTVQVDAQHFDDSVWLHLTRGDGTETFTPMQPKIELETLGWQKRPEPLPLPTDIYRIRKFNPWIPLIRFEDFIHRTLVSKT